MSQYSEYLKNCKEIAKARFFGEVKNRSNKYFTFKHVIDEDNIVLVTSNIKRVKDSLVMVVANNKAVYLKDWQVLKVHNYYAEMEGYAVKLCRKYFKTYTFKSNFEEFSFDEEDTFDSLKEVAATQDETAVALGHMG